MTSMSLHSDIMKVRQRFEDFYMKVQWFEINLQCITVPNICNCLTGANKINSITTTKHNIPKQLNLNKKLSVVIQSNTAL